MKLFLISGDECGVGKSTFANTLSLNVWSFATALRGDLNKCYPLYEWFRKDQEYKNTTYIKELNCNMRDALVKHGERRRAENPDYWANILAGRIGELYSVVVSGGSLAVDDLRYMNELRVIRERHPYMQITHFHLKTKTSLPTENDAAQLAEVADYIVVRS